MRVITETDRYRVIESANGNYKVQQKARAAYRTLAEYKTENGAIKRLQKLAGYRA